MIDLSKAHKALSWLATSLGSDYCQVKTNSIEIFNLEIFPEKITGYPKYSHGYDSGRLATDWLTAISYTLDKTGRKDWLLKVEQGGRVVGRIQHSDGAGESIKWHESGGAVHRFRDGTTFENVIDHLISSRGIGPWINDCLQNPIHENRYGKKIAMIRHASWKTISFQPNDESKGLELVDFKISKNDGDYLRDPNAVNFPILIRIEGDDFQKIKRKIIRRGTSMPTSMWGHYNGCVFVSYQHGSHAKFFSFLRKTAPTAKIEILRWYSMDSILLNEYSQPEMQRIYDLEVKESDLMYMNSLVDNPHLDLIVSRWMKGEIDSLAGAADVIDASLHLPDSESQRMLCESGISFHKFEKFLQQLHISDSSKAKSTAHLICSSEIANRSYCEYLNQRSYFGDSVESIRRANVLDVFHIQAKEHNLMDLASHINNLTQVESIRLFNFRGYESVEIDGLTHVNVLIGPNNAGKSSILYTLRRLTNVHPKHQPLLLSTLGNPSVQKSMYFGSPRFLTRDIRRSEQNGSCFLSLKSIQPPINLRLEPRAGDDSNERNVEVTVDRVELIPARIDDDMMIGAKHAINLLGHYIIYVPTVHAESNTIPERAFGTRDLARHLASWQMTSIGKSHAEQTRTRIERFAELCTKILGEDVRAWTKMDGEQVSVVVSVGSGEPEQLEDLGDGVAQVLTIAGAIIELGRGILLLEEPDLGLHPTIQRRLMRALTEQDTIQTLLTTHSNHIIDHNAKGISIYKVTMKNGCSAIENVMQDERRSILDDLGVQPSSLLFVNATIWVEGPTDRKLLRKLIELYKEEHPDDAKWLDEGTHFDFIFLGGTLIAHLDILRSHDEERGIKPEVLCAGGLFFSDSDGFERIDDNWEMWKQWKRSREGTYSVTFLRATIKGLKTHPGSVDDSFPDNSSSLWEDRANDYKGYKKLLRHIKMNQHFNANGANTRFVLLNVREMENVHSWARVCDFARGACKKASDWTCDQPEDWRQKFLGDVLRSCPDLDPARGTLSTTLRIRKPETEAPLTGTLKTAHKDTLANFDFYKTWNDLSDVLKSLGKEVTSFIIERNKGG